MAATAAAAAAAPAGDTTVIPFRTEVAPRVDPVFGDVARLRAGIDRFLALQGEMDQVRTEFSATVNGTLTRLGSAGPGAAAPAAPQKPAARVCPSGAMAQYGRALAAGGRYLGLGRQLEARYREIRRAEELGEAAGLTPDYRIKMKRARELYLELLRDYREMRVAFYEQLGAEMRHAGCALRAPTAEGPDPSSAEAWQLEEPSAPPAATPPPATTRVAPPAPPPAPAPAGAAPAIWIAVDNSHCPQRSQLSIDGLKVGMVAERQKLTVRTRAGPHEVCVLPDADKRACGDPGTVRRAYLYDGWTLVVRCEGK